MVELLPGSGGDFEVVADGKSIFSKAVTGRFPEPDEVVNKLKMK
jgi:selT/selW/selH-like putative selenoprotein